ncbi:hypothetical protein [Nonomuraea sp. NPDC052265]|uniref:hypothetical protein n=1 Tax=Nonomuraea sp. NPDC052265 TaxID=3364374 RepID=UPI0037CA4AE0
MTSHKAPSSTPMAPMTSGKPRGPSSGLAYATGRTGFRAATTCTGQGAPPDSGARLTTPGLPPATAPVC